MLGTTPKFVNILILVVLFLTGCSGKKTPEVKKEKQETETQPKHEEESDTLWLVDVVHTMDYEIEFHWDKEITVKGEKHTLFMKSERLKDDYEGVSTIVEGQKIKAQRHIGPNLKYSLFLYDSLDNLIADNSWNKYDLEKWIAMDLLAGSRGDKWFPVEYNEAFDRLFMSVYWMFDDSDFGEEYKLFLDRDLNVKEFFFDAYTGGGGCDCENTSSEDGKTYAFCSKIYRSNGNHIEIYKGKEITGSFVLNNEYTLVIENYDGKPPYKNAKILDRRGAVAHSFDYTGISGALGYTIPKFRVGDQNALFLLDAPIRSIFRIDLDNPMSVEAINIDSLEKMAEGEILEVGSSNRIDISSETKGFVLEYHDGKFRYHSETRDY